MDTTNAWSDVWAQIVPKFGQIIFSVALFAAVLIVAFWIASKARGVAERPTVITLMLGPAVVLVTIGLVIPGLQTILFSFRDPYGTTFVGLKNFGWAFTDPGMRQTLTNTVLWIVLAPVLSTGLGLLLAVLVDRIKHEALAKALIFMPMAISFVGASVVWKFVYAYASPENPQIGLLEQIVMAFGVKDPPNWILTTPLNTFLLMVIYIWVQTGFSMVVLSAAIKAVPMDINEAASLDGATGGTLFRTITMPIVRGTFVVVLTTAMVATLKLFDIVRTMTGGNFGTSVLANEMYSQTFVQFNSGHGAALAVILFIGVAPMIWYNVRSLRKERTIR